MISKSDGKIETIYKVVIEKEYSHPVEKVWAVLTQAEHVSKWMEYKTFIDLKVGGKYEYDFRDEGMYSAIITKIIPNSKLNYVFEDDVVSWTLLEKGNKTKLQFVHNGLTKEKAIELGAGWEAFIDYIDPYLLEKPFPTNRHDSLMKEYHEMV